MRRMPDVCYRPIACAVVRDDVEHVIFRFNRTVAVCEKRWHRFGTEDSGPNQIKRSDIRCIRWSKTNYPIGFNLDSLAKWPNCTWSRGFLAEKRRMNSYKERRMRLTHFMDIFDISPPSATKSHTAGMEMDGGQENKKSENFMWFTIQ